MVIRILQVITILITIFAINSVLDSIWADTYKKEGKESLKKNFPYVAVDKFGKVLNLNSSDGEARGYLGIAYTSVAEKTNNKDLLKKAIYEMKDARKTYEDPSINYHLAKTYELSGDIDTAIQKAVKSYNQIPSRQTKDKLTALYKTKGDMLLSQNKRDEAIKFYTKFVELKETNVTNEDIAGYEFLRDLMPDNFFVRYNLARLYMNQNVWEKAVIELEYIKKIGILNEDIMGKLIATYHSLGNKYYNEKKFNEAEIYLNSIFNIDKDGTYGYSILAIDILASIYEQIGNIDKAVELFMKLEKFDTHKGQGYRNIGHLFERKSNPLKAIEYFEKYLPFRPISDTGIFSTLGSLYEQVGKIDKAVETLMKLEDFDTQKGQGYYQVGHLYNRKSNLQKAIEYYEKYLPFRPISDTGIFIILGDMYEQVGNINRALEIYNKLEDINLYKWRGHYHIGLLYERKEKWADAIREFEYGMEIRPNDSHILLKIGQFYEKIGNYKKALETYKRIVDIDPTKIAELNFPMARLYEKMGEREKALSLIKTSKLL